MHLPFDPPLAPMLSSPVAEIPSGDGWLFEPKWDGFRTLVFRDGEEILLQSRDEKPMNRYFPELIAPLKAALPERCILDGEVVIAGPDGLDFEALLLRIHPAASRVKLLAEQTPASFVAWDLLALGDEDLRQSPLEVRRERLDEVLRHAAAPVHLSPVTRDRAGAADWFQRFEGAGRGTLGGGGRWNRGKPLSGEPLRMGRVVGGAFDHMQGSRFRHAARFVRWRRDKKPSACRYDQLEVTPPYELERVFGARHARHG